MQSNSDIFLEERDNEMGSFFADQALDNQQQEMERILSEDQWEEDQLDKIENELQPIDIKNIEPSGELIQMQFGDGEIQNFSGTSNQIAENIIYNILEGHISPLDFAVKKKLITDALDIAFKNDKVKKLAIEEVEKHGKQGATALNAKLTITNRATYQYDADPTWNSLKTQMKPIEDKLKAQEEKIKIACKTNCNLVSDEGEIIASVVPAPSTTSIAVSFKKK